MAPVVDRNIQAMITRREAVERSRDAQSRIADAVTTFTGSMTFVYVHLAVFGTWIVVNLGWLPGIRPFDPSFVVLAMMASVEAIFLSTSVLINQNRMQALADERADLDLPIHLLTEQEVTRLITLASGIAAKLGIEEAHDPGAGRAAPRRRPGKGDRPDRGDGGDTRRDA